MLAYAPTAHHVPPECCIWCMLTACRMRLCCSNAMKQCAPELAIERRCCLKLAVARIKVHPHVPRLHVNTNEVCGPAVLGFAGVRTRPETNLARTGTTRRLPSEARRSARRQLHHQPFVRSIPARHKLTSHVLVTKDWLQAACLGTAADRLLSQLNLVAATSQ